MNILVFDIETVPDVTRGRVLEEVTGLSDEEMGDALLQRRLQTSGHEFLPHYLHHIVAISVVLRTQDQLKVWSLGETDSTEQDLLQRFFDGLQRFMPHLVSWNGTSFDLPVIHYRALLHGVASPLYWDSGEDNQAFKWNNYLNRYHQRHLDLMDVLSAYQGRSSAPLDKIAVMLGFPGKMGMSGAQVWQHYCQQDISAIRHYCETDVLNTYLVYLRFQLIRAQLSQTQYEQECQLVRDTLTAENKPHLSEFLQQWPMKTPQQ